jgi:fibronectin-binding autotransporter adhesin
MQSLTIGQASGDILFDRTSTNGPQALNITNNSTSGNITFDSVIRNNGSTASNVTQNGGGIMTLALSTNSYTGFTRINSGSISVSSLANGGSASGIGQSTSDATNLRFDSGKLTYTGAAVSTNRNFCRRLSKSGFNCLSKSGQEFLMFDAA